MSIKIVSFGPVGSKKVAFVDVVVDGERMLTFKTKDEAWDVVMHWAAWIEGQK